MFHPRSRALIAIATIGLAVPSLAAVPAKKAGAAPAAAQPTIKPAANGDVTRAQIQAEVKQVMRLADTNHDGYMSRQEFAVRMGVVINRVPPGSSAAPTKADAQKMLDAANAAFNAVDTNHDGKLSLAEMSARPLAAFDAMDTNHDGIVTLAEKQAAHDANAANAAGPGAAARPQGPAGPPELSPTQPGR